MTVAKQDKGLMRIGEFAKALDTTAKTLRHYERMGLLQPPQRTDKDYRLYDATDLRRARQILGLRRLGLSIEDILSLLEDDDHDITRRQRLLGVLDQKLQEIDQTLGVLQGQRDDLAARYMALLDTPRERVGTCLCAALLMDCRCDQATRSQSNANSPTKTHRKTSKA